jgi:nickel/cobalt exporter
MDIAAALQQGTLSWLFVPSAILLGALHGLEPGHSKTMMAAFIIAIRGTVMQAVLLGLAATVSHTAIVWLVAIAGLYFGANVATREIEPYLQLASGMIILSVAAWMALTTWRHHRRAAREHGHDHARDHAHGPEIRRIETDEGAFILEIFEHGVPPRWHLLAVDGSSPRAQDITVETERPDGRRQTFAFVDNGGILESLEPIPEPHAFTARLRIAHADHSHDYDVEFAEHDHAHADAHDHAHGLDVVEGGDIDAHQLAHANDIRRRFATAKVTTPQIIAFGLTGGLIPCPAAITVLLLCLQLKQIAMGATLVLCFSIGLAVTLVATGVVAALAADHASKRWTVFGEIARRAPYLSAALVTAVGLYLIAEGALALA